MSALERVSRVLDATSNYSAELAEALKGQHSNNADLHEKAPHNSHHKSNHKQHASKYTDKIPTSKKYKQKGHSSSTKGKILDQLGARLC
eukprot:CAMPEP_0206187712 /NCGR_PEP_ID=MMETSP0166-20121206/3161_1 /ASSEMBLY_ACC=CAM_ASM_000260 /TAXON_ID=95228 /ORGANISM="Vannella robusta, Strain DIVA3 518/3/11/1/6" /LENGTH=88 /DNA_ID=CAMNT_0053603339 /DNA_START=618 /DNA_END=884 /DNA_ORIENTATION=-